MDPAGVSASGEWAPRCSGCPLAIPVRREEGGGLGGRLGRSLVAGFACCRDLRRGVAPVDLGRLQVGWQGGAERSARFGTGPQPERRGSRWTEGQSRPEGSDLGEQRV